MVQSMQRFLPINRRHADYFRGQIAPTLDLQTVQSPSWRNIKNVNHTWLIPLYFSNLEGDFVGTIK
jgi:hypothetical protein